MQAPFFLSEVKNGAGNWCIGVDGNCGVGFLIMMRGVSLEEASKLAAKGFLFFATGVLAVCFLKAMIPVAVVTLVFLERWCLRMVLAILLAIICSIVLRFVFGQKTNKFPQEKNHKGR